MEPVTVADPNAIADMLSAYKEGFSVVAGVLIALLSGYMPTKRLEAFVTILMAFALGAVLQWGATGSVTFAGVWGIGFWVIGGSATVKMVGGAVAEGTARPTDWRGRPQ